MVDHLLKTIQCR